VKSSISLSRFCVPRVSNYFVGGSDDVTWIIRRKVVRRKSINFLSLRYLSPSQSRLHVKRRKRGRRRGCSRPESGTNWLRPQWAQPRQIGAVYLCRSTNKIGVVLSQQSVWSPQTIDNIPCIPYENNSFLHITIYIVRRNEK